MGEVSSNGTGICSFTHAIKEGISGIKFIQPLKDLKLGCQVAAIPEPDITVLSEMFPEATVRSLKSLTLIYGCLAAAEASKNAGLEINSNDALYNTGCIFGNSFSDSMFCIKALPQ